MSPSFGARVASGTTASAVGTLVGASVDSSVGSGVSGTAVGASVGASTATAKCSSGASVGCAVSAAGSSASFGFSAQAVITENSINAANKMLIHFFIVFPPYSGLTREMPIVFCHCTESALFLQDSPKKVYKFTTSCPNGALHPHRSLLFDLALFELHVGNCPHERAIGPDGVRFDAAGQTSCALRSSARNSLPHAR